MMNLVVTYGPVESVKDIQPFFGVFSRERFTVAGRQVTLDVIEKEILLPRYKDPRIHITNFVPSIEALEEFKIQTNAYSAEIGFGGGAVTSMTMKLL